MVKGILTSLTYFCCFAEVKKRAKIFHGHIEKGSRETSLGTLQPRLDFHVKSTNTVR